MLALGNLERRRFGAGGSGAASTVSTVACGNRVGHREIGVKASVEGNGVVETAEFRRSEKGDLGAAILRPLKRFLVAFRLLRIPAKVRHQNRLGYSPASANIRGSTIS